MKFLKILLLLLLVSFKFIASPMNPEGTMHNHFMKRYILKSAHDDSRTQLCDTEINESEESSEHTKEFDLSKIAFTFSEFFTFKLFVLKQTYLTSWIFKSKIHSCFPLFALYLNFRI
ncbi:MULTISPECIES: hypothetical protein [unclassified Arcicella]|uniref:hypothetical protein n=1 Tax=unclassified Arcicella TaxID=2644986 RepID=UPI0028564D5A|nr:MULTISPECIES: hypothetical protein [unclassified Arcicella]MDR6562543.1 hypothetical protein [Arcicella sp. BE51]MDR6812630.1 hypothetical protein [Arcicella sp. BE140]MDR6823942.1 hypothetical protein [Arcicella sp. BE139]